jgi:hypothetical protein
MKITVIDLAHYNVGPLVFHEADFDSPFPIMDTESRKWFSPIIEENRFSGDFTERPWTARHEEYRRFFMRLGIGEHECPKTRR